MTSAPIICSVLIPSRARYDRLVKTIDSVFATAADPRRVEVIVRLDEDDEASIRQCETLAAWRKAPRGVSSVTDLTENNIAVVIGPRLNGYASLSQFYEECAARARGAWLWVMNDDAVIDDASKYPRLDGKAYQLTVKRWDEPGRSVVRRSHPDPARALQAGGQWLLELRRRRLPHRVEGLLAARRPRPYR